MEISNATKEQIISAGKTFAVAFIVTAVTLFTQGNTMDFSLAFWTSLAMAGVRAGLTAVIAPYIPTKLGGKKV